MRRQRGRKRVEIRSDWGAKQIKHFQREHTGGQTCQRL